MMDLIYHMVLILFQIFKIGLIFKRKDGYKLELQTSEKMNLFDSAKLIDKTKNGENIPSL